MFTHPCRPEPLNTMCSTRSESAMHWGMDGWRRAFCKELEEDPRISGSPGGSWLWLNQQGKQESLGAICKLTKCSSFLKSAWGLPVTHSFDLGELIGSGLQSAASSRQELLGCPREEEEHISHVHQTETCRILTIRLCGHSLYLSWV